MLASPTRPLADLVIDAEVSQWEQLLRFAEGQIGALRAAAQLVAAMPPPDVGRHVARLADRLDLDHSLVTEAVTDALNSLVAAGPASAFPSSSHDPPAWQARATTPQRRSSVVHVCRQDSADLNCADGHQNLPVGSQEDSVSTSVASIRKRATRRSP
jgi:hypothetical protein